MRSINMAKIRKSKTNTKHFACIPSQKELEDEELMKKKYKGKNILFNVEPLSGKYENYGKDLWYDKINKERLGTEGNEILEEVKLAVMWLKNKVEDRRFIADSVLEDPVVVATWVMKWIDQAFKDLKNKR